MRRRSRYRVGRWFGRSLRLTDGRVLAEDAVVWLPPVKAGTIIALGLNYAERAKELSFTAQEEPLVFPQGSRHRCSDIAASRVVLPR